MSSNKKDLQGGIANLLGGADRQRATGAEPQPSEQQPQTEGASSTAPDFKVQPTTKKDEEDLINSIEDAKLRAALEARRKEGRGRPRKNTDATGKRTDGYSRTSFIIKDTTWAKIREIAFRKTLTMKEIVELALEMLIKEYEKTNGEVTPHPEKYKGDIHDIFKPQQEDRK
jgi:hypothetical protein